MSSRKFLSEQSNDALRNKFNMLIKTLMGKSMNVYSGQPNTNQNFLKTYRIVSLHSLGTIGTKVIISVDDQEGHGRTDLMKTCGRKAFENANAVGGKNRFLYSDKLNDKLEREFCTRSKGGSVVPTADFSSVETGDNTEAMTESRKVVKLKESDITRLVKKVMVEQTNQSQPPTDRRVASCDERGLFKVLIALKDPRRMVELTVDKRNPEYMVFRDESGMGCAAKRKDLFK